jgi:hypothetical protein
VVGLRAALADVPSLESESGKKIIVDNFFAAFTFQRRVCKR